MTGDCRIDLDANRYSVPYQLVGRTVEVEICGDELTVWHRGSVKARHPLATGRHHEVEDPRHTEGLVRRRAVTTPPCELQRPLGEYEAVAGGAW